MLKETIHYEDFNGTKRTTTQYFHLNEKEVIDLQAHSEHGLQFEMEEAIRSNNPGRALDYITNLVHLSYGVKSQDGEQFTKSPEILANFVNSAYYSDFIVGLLQDNGLKGQEFISGIMPKKLVDRATAQANGQNVSVDGTVPKENYESTVYAPSARENFANRTQPTPPSEFVPSEPTQIQIPQPVAPAPQEDPEYQAYLAEKRRREAEAQQADFRVPAEDDQVIGLPRPPHEQNNSQQ